MQISRYEQGLGLDSGMCEAKQQREVLPDWFDEDDMEWMQQRHLEIEMENGVLLFNWMIQQLQLERQFQMWKIGWQIRKVEEMGIYRDDELGKALDDLKAMYICSLGI